MRAVIALLMCWLAVPAAGQQEDDPLARGDAAWPRRAEGQRDGRAAAEPIAEVVAAYEEALGQEPTNLAVMARLLHALYFRGQFATPDPEAKQQVFDRGRRVTEMALDQLGARVGGREKLDEMAPEELRDALREVPEAVAIYFWGAANWGMWGEVFGKLAAARQGVARRLSDYARAVMALDPHYEGAGGHRILGRLHTEAPRIPFFTRWIDRDTAIRELRRAVELGPDEPFNRFYLADALLKHRRRDGQDEALALLRELGRLEPRPERRVEDSFIRAEARKMLAAVSR